MTSLAQDMGRRDFDLRGVHLVRASAGTGKTYSIQSLYLRLIIEQRLTVQQLLVVTFTEAATKELRDRLRRVLQHAANHLDGKRPADEAEQREFDERIGPLLALADPEIAKHAVRVALLDFDLAAIHTIHAFCHRALKRFAFETGQAFDVEFDADKKAAISGLCDDWWRRNLYGAEPELVRFLAEEGLSRKNLISLAQKRIAKPNARIAPEGIALADVPVRLQQVFEVRRKALEAFLAQTDADAGTYLPQTARSKRFRDGLAQCLAALSDPCPMNAGLQALRTLAQFEKSKAGKDTWESRATWTLPPEVAALAQTAANLGALIKNKRAVYSWENGRLRHKSIDAQSMDSAMEALRKAYEQARPRIEQILSDPEGYPRSDKKKPAALVETLKVLGELLAHPDTTGDPGEYAKRLVALADLKSELPMPLTRSVDALENGGAVRGLLRDVCQVARAALAGAAVSVREAYEAGKTTRQSMTFDDLLLNLYAALTDPERGESLRAALCEEYRAALIDEFQDTDPVQYGIFRAIFIRGQTHAPCFVVGDPKQAIYGFRNGDIHTYLAATRDIAEDAVHELDKNFRAEANLISAINRIFGDRPREGNAFTFRHLAMRYDGTLQAKGKKPQDSLTVDGAIDRAPFKLWYYTGEQGAAPGKDSLFARRVYADTAAEILRLLGDDATRIAGGRVRPDQIAVLVRTHDEADYIAEELAVRGVPAVRQGVQHVFGTDEAKDFAVVLEALVEPRSASRVRAALATRLLGIPHRDIAALNEGACLPLPAEWPQPAGGDASSNRDAAGFSMEDWIRFFDELHATWRRQGFVTAFNVLAARTALRGRLAGMERGERSLTNVLHLVELAHKAIAAGRLSLEGALTWFARQMDPETREEGDDYELRLETDSNAVRILTVFKSKGLEFPIVFVPTLWRRFDKAGRGECIEYHDAAGNQIVDLDRKTHADKARTESLEEEIRLAYVAATRAVHRTYLVWADFKTEPADSALSWLLGAGLPADDLRKQFAPDVTVEERLCAAPAAPVVTITAPAGPLTPGPDPGELFLPAAPDVDKRRGHTSFSSLMPHPGRTGPGPAEGYDFDANDVPAATAGAAAPAGAPIFAFPAGARTGECWHRILEILPFNADDGRIRETVNEQLDLFGLTRNRDESLRQERQSVTFAMVRRVLRARLEPEMPGAAAFTLRDVSARARKNELEFSFPAAGSGGIEPRRTAEIRDTLREHWQGIGRYRSFLAHMEHWDREIPGGFMTGFIDLFFRHGAADGGQFYIADWKSNRRSGKPEDFDPAGLREEMAAHGYFLQYLIYTVAVHQFLKARLAGYDYGRHFGGVFYLFLRGVDDTPGRGIHYDRPSRELIEGLSSVLGDFK